MLEKSVRIIILVKYLYQEQQFHRHGLALISLISKKTNKQTKKTKQNKTNQIRELCKRNDFEFIEHSQINH